MSDDGIDWPTLCAGGAFLAIRVDDDTDDCPTKGCDRPRKHSGRHNGQPKKRPTKKAKRNEWRFG